MELVAMLGAGAVAVALLVYKRWGVKYIKKWFDDPATAEDESAVVVNLGEAAIKLAVEAAVAKGLAEALKNPSVDRAKVAAEHLYAKMAGSMSMDDAKKLVDAAMKR